MTRKLSFVWNGLQKYCVMSPKHVVISSNRVYCIGTLESGELPLTCVSGSGSYVHTGTYGEFQLYLSYLDVQVLGDTVLVTAIIDLTRPVTNCFC